MSYPYPYPPASPETYESTNAGWVYRVRHRCIKDLILAKRRLHLQVQNVLTESEGDLLVHGAGGQEQQSEIPWWAYWGLTFGKILLIALFPCSRSWKFRPIFPMASTGLCKRYVYSKPTLADLGNQDRRPPACPIYGVSGESSPG